MGNRWDKKYQSSETTNSSRGGLGGGEEALLAEGALSCAIAIATSGRARPQKIVEMHETDGFAGLRDDQHRDLRRIEDFQCFACDLVRPYGLGRACHHLLNGSVEQVRPHMPAQVAISDNPREVAVAVGDADTAVAFAGHFHD